MHGSDSPLNYMNEQEATEMKERVFAQLDQFDGSFQFLQSNYLRLTHSVEPHLQFNVFASYV
jgi:hypothetical protein